MVQMRQCNKRVLAFALHAQVRFLWRERQMSNPFSGHSSSGFGGGRAKCSVIFLPHALVMLGAMSKQQSVDSRSTCDADISTDPAVEATQTACTAADKDEAEGAAAAQANHRCDGRGAIATVYCACKCGVRRQAGNICIFGYWG